MNKTTLISTIIMLGYKKVNTGVYFKEKHIAVINKPNLKMLYPNDRTIIFSKYSQLYNWIIEHDQTND